MSTEMCSEQRKGDHLPLRASLSPGTPGRQQSPLGDKGCAPRLLFQEAPDLQLRRFNSCFVPWQTGAVPGLSAAHSAWPRDQQFGPCPPFPWPGRAVSAVTAESPGRLFAPLGVLATRAALIPPHPSQHISSGSCRGAKSSGCARSCAPSAPPGRCAGETRAAGPSDGPSILLCSREAPARPRSCRNLRA